MSTPTSSYGTPDPDDGHPNDPHPPADPTLTLDDPTTQEPPTHEPTTHKAPTYEHTSYEPPAYEPTARGLAAYDPTPAQPLAYEPPPTGPEIPPTSATFTKTEPAPAVSGHPVDPPRSVRMRTVVFGLVLLVIAGAVLVGQLTDLTVDPGGVILALMIGGGLLLIAGARRS